MEKFIYLYIIATSRHLKLFELNAKPCNKSHLTTIVLKTFQTKDFKLRMIQLVSCQALFVAVQAKVGY